MMFQVSEPHGWRPQRIIDLVGRILARNLIKDDPVKSDDVI